MIFTTDSFIYGGKCHRPWHTGKKQCSLNVAIHELAYHWCMLQRTVVLDLCILKTVDTTSKYVARSHHLSTSRYLEQPRYCWKNQCNHMWAHRLELRMDPAPTTSCTLTLVWDTWSIWAGDLCHLRSTHSKNSRQYTFPDLSVETSFGVHNFQTGHYSPLLNPSQAKSSEHLLIIFNAVCLLW